MSAIALSATATDLVAQNYEQRLRASARALFVHGFIPRAEWHRLERKISERADLERREAASRR
jgi:hypothetical protein